MLDFCGRLLGAGTMSESDAEKLSEVTTFGYFKQIWDKYNETGFDMIDFFGLLRNILGDDEIKVSDYEEGPYYYKLAPDMYVYIAKDLSKLDLYELEKKVDELG